MADTDADLVLQARRGDAAAFEQLVRRHMRKAYLAALAQLGEPAAAEDVTQDALITALERLDDCEPERFAAWLVRIARNRAHNYRRRESVRAALPLDEAAGAHARGGDPLDDAHRAELRTQLLEALDTLSATQREAVYLFDVEGLRHAEIAALLGLKEGNVRYHVMQGRRALREKLGGAYEEELHD